MSDKVADMRKINKLQKEIEQLQKELSLEAKQEDLIRGYEMKEGNYQIIITIYEANELQPRGTNFWLFKTNKTACDAFVEIQVRDKIQRSSVREGTNNPIFDENFFFKFDNMTLEDLDRSTITIRVYDKKTFILSDSLLGSFQMDWTNVYFKRNHQIYRGWLMLSDPYDVVEGVMGYLLVNVAVLGPHDQVTVHDSAFIKDPLTTMEDTVTMPKLKLIDYCITIDIYRGENLVPLDEFQGDVYAYVIAKFSGNKVETSPDKNGVNPEWNETIKIGTGVPTKSRYVTLEVRNKNYLSKDDIIGVIKIPLIDLKQQAEPKWGHIYGPPLSGKDVEPYNTVTKMQVYGQDIGSHYRGKIMYRITGQKDVLTKNKRTKINYQFPYKPTPVVPLKSYVLRVQLLEGFELPLKQDCYIHVCIGQYFLLSKSYGKHKDGYLEFYDILPDKKVQLTEDPTQIPDIILYFAKGTRERDRISFIRIKAETVVGDTIFNPMKIYELQPDLSLGLAKPGFDSGGYVTARIHLFRSKPPLLSSLKAEYGEKIPYVLKMFLYQGQGLPPCNDEGDVDPQIVFNFLGSKVQSDLAESTYNPIWNQVLTLKLNIQDLLKISLEKGMNCKVFDHENFGGFDKQPNFIGEFLIKFSSSMRRSFKVSEQGRKINFIYRQPEWYPVLNNFIEVGDKCLGKILMCFALFRASDLPEMEIQGINKIQNKINEKMVQLFLLGARELKNNEKYLSSQKISMELKVATSMEKILKTDEYPLKNSAAEFNEMHMLNLNLPKNKALIPYMDVKLYTSHLTKKFFGFNSVSLYQVLPKLLEDDDEKAKKKIEVEEQSQQTILDVEKLQQQLDIVRERKKKIEGKYTKKKKVISKVEELMVPNELGGRRFGVTDDTVKKLEFDKLLDEFESKYESDPQYDYVRRLESQMDEKQQKDVSYSKLQSVIDEKSERDEQSEKPREMMKQKFEEDAPLSFPSEQEMIQKPKSDQGNLFDLLNPDLANKPKKKQSSRSEKSQRQMMKQPMNKDEEQPPEQLNYDQQKKMFQKKREKYTEKSSQVERQIEHAKLMEDEQFIKSAYDEAANRYSIEKKSRYSSSTYASQFGEESEKALSNFNIGENDQIQQMKYEEKAIRYRDVEEAIRQEKKFTKEAMEREANYKYAAAVKLSLFQWQRKKNDDDRETYQDYDTDPEEDLDIIPEWYKGRKILSTDLEDLIHSKKKIFALPIYKGGKNVPNLQIRSRVKVATLKFVAISETPEIAKQKQSYYKKLLKPKAYVARLYVLKGKSLISRFQGKPTTYLRFSFRGVHIDLKQKTLNKECYNPQYYICQEVPIQLPGASTIRIDVMQIDGVLGNITPRILGYTEIDLQERHFMKKWHLFTGKKPIELRNLYSEYGIGTQGRLEVWIDLVEKKNWLSTPPYKIHPPPFDDFELRTVVWSTKDCVYKNQAFESNDVYVRGMIGTSPAQETDTHWACRSVGNFNYRFKFKVAYPPKPEDMYSDIYTIQIWDRDLIGYNNLIGETRINLNRIHKIIQKAVKRKAPVKGAMKIKEKGLIVTDRFWFDVYNHKVKDQFGQLESQGKVQLSFELVPYQAAQEDLANGYGRSQPNVYPTLQQPAGRLSFNIFHPLDFFKQLLGPNLYNSICTKLCCCLVIIIIFVLGYFILGQLIAAAIVG